MWVEDQKEKKMTVPPKKETSKGVGENHFGHQVGETEGES